MGTLFRPVPTFQPTAQAGIIPPSCDATVTESWDLTTLPASLHNSRVHSRLRSRDAGDAEKEKTIQRIITRTVFSELDAEPTYLTAWDGVNVD